MTLKITFLGQDISFPSGSGPIKCPNCIPGQAYGTYGPDGQGNFVYCHNCKECGYHCCNREVCPYNKTDG